MFALYGHQVQAWSDQGVVVHKTADASRCSITTLSRSVLLSRPACQGMIKRSILKRFIPSNVGPTGHIA